MELARLFPFIVVLTVVFPVCCVRGQNESRLYRTCENDANYTSNSTYEANLRNVFSSLTSDDQADYGFYNYSAGESPDRAYAFALCRGDVSMSACRRCVNYSTGDLPELCPTQRAAIVYYENCMLRYSNSSIFRDHNGPSFMKWNNKNVTDVVAFNQALESLLPDLRNKSSLGDSRWNCLDKAFRKFSNNFPGKEGGRVHFPVCHFRYEINQFYETKVSVPPPSPSVGGPSPPSVPSPTNDNLLEGKGSNVARNVIIVVASSVSFVVLLVCIYMFLRCKRLKKKLSGKGEINSVESLQFDFNTIRIATNNFSNDNMLGCGGFGAVYKGNLSDGQEIAVKRLAANSGQGDLEFKNEVQLVAKLQHRNLVRLLGFCLQSQERLLVYEFVPNASLDYFLFDPSKQMHLDWERRYKIIGGIARGLLYLHEDSRLRIIHRDLKPSNILLDDEMHPKIADFGMARLFVMDQTRGETSRIVGTYGYMAPEYVVHGRFSVKSDVYSFGVLILELVSGQKISCFRVGETAEDLISFTWESWRVGKTSEMVDQNIRDGSRDEIMRCIHIGLLCVQESVAARPTMGSILLMLSSYSISLPVPSKPAFFTRSVVESEFPTLPQELSQQAFREVENWSINEASITELATR